MPIWSILVQNNHQFQLSHIAKSNFQQIIGIRIHISKHLCTCRPLLFPFLGFIFSLSLRNTCACLFNSVACLIYHDQFKSLTPSYLTVQIWDQKNVTNHFPTNNIWVARVPILFQQWRLKTFIQQQDFWFPFHLYESYSVRIHWNNTTNDCHICAASHKWYISNFWLMNKVNFF